MKKKFPTLKICAAALSFFLASGFTLPFPGKSSELFETYPVAKIPWGKTVALESSLYQVGEEAEVSSDFELTFSVQSPYGVYRPVGLKDLAVLLKEIELIKLLKAKASKDQVAQGAENSVREMGRGFKLLATHPVGTVKNVGKATGEFFKKGGRMFSKKKQKTLKKPSLKEKLSQGAMRDVANEFGADVYTDNLELAGELRRIAKGRMGGSVAIAVAQFFVPVTLIGSVALTASSVSSSADQIVNTKDPWELYDLNRKAFTAMGASDKSIDRFLLDNPYFNPREQTRIRFYLESLKAVAGWKEVFAHLSNIKTEKQAEQSMIALEMLMGLAEKHKDFTEMGRQDFLYVSTQDKVFVFWPYDFVYVNGRGEEFLKRLGGFKEKFPDAKIQVLNLGLLSPLMQSRLGALGVKAAEGIFFKEELNDD